MDAARDRQASSDPGSSAAFSSALQVRDLGRMAYEPTLALQREVNLAVSLGEKPDTLLLVEHDPVITISHRREAASHLVAGQAQLAHLGITVAETDRGGDITYHGPGQLVAYPILRLQPLGLNLGRYMRLLEEVVIQTVARYGIVCLRDAGATGVWVEPAAGGPLAKLCAMGVRVRKNTTMHGLALNVCTDLEHFQTIVPCGLVGRPVTSLQQLLGEDAPHIAQVKKDLTEVFIQQLQP